MRKFITVIARFIAALFAIWFVISTILALLLTTINRQMYNANLIKNALVEQNFYAHLPEIVGIALTSSFVNNPCAQNQLACNIDGASPELKACLTTALGTDAYETLGSGQRIPTETELQLAQPCLDQYGNPLTDNSQSGMGGSSGGSGMPSFMQNLTAADWQAILTILLPPENLQTMTESTLDQLFAYLNGETDTVTVALDKLKEHLAGRAGTDLITRLINSQPPCSVQALVDIVSGTNNGGLHLCKPTEVVRPIMISLLQEQLNGVVTELPDQTTIIRPLSPGTLPSGTSPFGADPISTLRIVRLIMRLSALFPLALLLLITLFAVRSLKSWMRWWGIPIFVSGMISFGLGISALPAFNTAWIMFIVPRIPPFIPADIAGIGRELVRSFVHTITAGIVLWAIILIATGLAAWVGSSFIKTRYTMAMPIPPPTPAP